MDFHPLRYLLLAAALAFPCTASAQGYRFTYQYWSSGTSPDTRVSVKPQPATIEFLAEQVRGELPGKVFVLNTKNGELLHIDHTAKTFGYAELEAYMDKTRSASRAASTIVNVLPDDVKKLAEMQVKAKGIDPLVWTQTIRRAEAAGRKCAFVDGKSGAQIVRSVCSERSLLEPVAAQVAALEARVAEGTDGQRISGVFGNFPWPLDFPFSAYGLPLVIEQSPVPGTPLRKFYEYVSSGPEKLSADRFRAPPGYRQVDLFAGR